MEQTTLLHVKLCSDVHALSEAEVRGNSCVQWKRPGGLHAVTGCNESSIVRNYLAGAKFDKFVINMANESIFARLRIFRFRCAMYKIFLPSVFSFIKFNGCFSFALLLFLFLIIVLVKFRAIEILKISRRVDFECIICDNE